MDEDWEKQTNYIEGQSSFESFLQKIDLFLQIYGFQYGNHED